MKKHDAGVVLNIRNRILENHGLCLSSKIRLNFVDWLFGEVPPVQSPVSQKPFLSSFNCLDKMGNCIIKNNVKRKGGNK